MLPSRNFLCFLAVCLVAMVTISDARKRTRFNFPSHRPSGYSNSQWGQGRQGYGGQYNNQGQYGGSFGGRYGGSQGRYGGQGQYGNQDQYGGRYQGRGRYNQGNYNQGYNRGYNQDNYNRGAGGRGFRIDNVGSFAAIPGGDYRGKMY